MPSRFVLVFSVLNAALALPFLLPPSHAHFEGQRTLLAIARSFQGPVWFASYSLLQLSGALSPLSLFLTASALAGATAVVAEHMWRSADELAELLPSLALLYLAFGFTTTFYGGVLVQPPQSCTIESGERTGQSIVWYTERGWSPGAHYFLLLPPVTAADPPQLDYIRLDLPVNDPCNEHEALAIFPLEPPE